MHAADVDADGDIDVLSASRKGQIEWYENTDGKGTFGNQRVITTGVSAESLYTADMDGDGDVDVLSATSDVVGHQVVAWYENTDGKGTFCTGRFGNQRVIITITEFANFVYATDVDADGDVDALSASDVIAWYENTDGKGTFGSQRVITADVKGRSSVYVTDLDGDGDVDVLSSSFDGIVVWYENADGKGAFGNPRVITADVRGLSSLYATDVDGDGDADVLSSSFGGIVWYENSDGKGTFGIQRFVTRQRSPFRIRGRR
jgi:hypothetical protein